MTVQDFIHRHYSSAVGESPTGHVVAIVAGVALIAITGLVLAVRRRWPLAVLATATVCTSAYLALGYTYGPILIAFFVAVYSAARHLPMRVSLPACGAALALLLIVGAIFALRRGGPVPVQVVTVAATGGSEGGAGAGPSASVTANGYVVARTRASVSAKLPGRIADLRVSEGSTIRRGEIIATLENADYAAQAAQAKAAVATSRAMPC